MKKLLEENETLNANATRPPGFLEDLEGIQCTTRWSFYAFIAQASVYVQQCNFTLW